jgi:hypothetical protein
MIKSKIAADQGICLGEEYLNLELVCILFFTLEHIPKISWGNWLVFSAEPGSALP